MKEHTEQCKCPFCADELTHHCAEPEFCQPCGVAFVECPGCKHTFSDTLEKCPRCGAARKGHRQKHGKK